MSIALSLPYADPTARRKLVIGTPVGNQRTWVEHNAAKRMLGFHLSRVCPNTAVKTIEFGGTGLDRARNTLVRVFLDDPEATDLLFWDADLALDPEHIEKLLLSPFDVVGAVYPLKEFDWAKVHALALGGCPPQYLPALASGLCANFTEEQASRALLVGTDTFIEVESLGTGMLLIRRAVLEKFIAHYNQGIAYKGSKDFDPAERMHLVFACQRDPANDSPDGGYLSEDYAFCRMWKMMGGKVHAYTDAQVAHCGTHVFRSWLGLSLRIARSAGKTPHIERT